MIKITVMYVPTFDCDTYEFTNKSQGIAFAHRLLERKDVYNIEITII